MVDLGGPRGENTGGKTASAKPPGGGYPTTADNKKGCSPGGFTPRNVRSRPSAFLVTPSQMHAARHCSEPSVSGAATTSLVVSHLRQNTGHRVRNERARGMSSFSADDSEAWIRSTPPRVSSGARVSSDARLTVLPHSPRGRGGGGAVSRCLPSLAIGKRCTSFSLSNQQLENQLALAAMTYMAQRGCNCGH